MAGNEEALQQLELDKVSYPWQSPPNVSPDNLQVNYMSVLNIAVAARELQFSLIEQQSQIAMQLMQTIAKSKGITLDHKVDSQDVAEIMLALINDEQQRLKSLNPPSDIAGLESEAEEELSVQGEATANDVPPLPPAAVIKQQQLSDPADSEPHDTAPLPPPEALKKNIPSSVPKMADDDDSQSYASTDNEVMELAVAQKAVQSSHKETGRNTSDTPSVTTPSVTSSYINASSKNKRWQCLLCSFFGTHLQSHITAKHPTTFTAKPEQIPLVHRHDNLSRSQGGKKQVRQFQCTYKKCGAIVTRIGQHLLQVHKIQDQQQRAHEETVDHHQLKVDADVDDISSFAESDDEVAMPANKNTKWRDIYLAKDPKRSALLQVSGAC